MILIKYHVIFGGNEQEAKKYISRKLNIAESDDNNDGIVDFDGCEIKYHAEYIEAANHSTLIVLEAACEAAYAEQMEAFDLRFTSNAKDRKGGTCIIRQIDGLSHYYALEAENKIYEIEMMCRDVVALYFHRYLGIKCDLDIFLNSGERKNETRDRYSNEFELVNLNHFKRIFSSPMPLGNMRSLQEDMLKCKRGEISFDEFVEKYKEQPMAERISPKNYSQLVDFVNNNWSEIYDIRCRIAHHLHIRSGDVDKLKNLYEQFKVIIEMLIKEISRNNITMNGVENAENVFARIKEMYPIFNSSFEYNDKVYEFFKRHLSVEYEHIWSIHNDIIKS